MASDELLVVGLDLETGRQVHIDEQPMDQWRQLGYAHRESVVCAACFSGMDDVTAGTRVPLVPKGRIGGSRRFHFAHPPGMAPPGGHHPETLWHLEAKLLLERWARALPNVSEVRQEQWIPTRDRRADVHVHLADGSRLALEAQTSLISDQLWQARHRSYTTAGIQDIWFMRPGTSLPHVLFAEQAPLCILDLAERTVHVVWGKPHLHSGRWWEAGDLTVFALHHPPCPGDDIHEERVPLAELGLSTRGLDWPEHLTDKLTNEHRAIRKHADSVRAQAEEDNRRRHRLAAQAARSPQRSVTGERRIATPRTRTAGRTGTRRPRCAVCASPLADVLVPYGTHVAVRNGDSWVDCLGQPCTVQRPQPASNADKTTPDQAHAEASGHHGPGRT
ncbi:competence protein CoiA family protein [Streptomyces lydicus]|uniref:competence protein CoiA family protein n=1 Tax=Streptomyces lydicus TaxID=47763 RepID=UPI00101131D6|nr:competence protein CoiA family protein [Streptomyces lydicus]MCZ1012269.1 competence protein CoiA family protein [Streptomyces lydicus]